MMDYHGLSKAITAELDSVFNRVDAVEVDRLINAVVKAEKVFIFAVGRVFLSLQFLGKRLGHLEIDCQIVGSMNEKPILQGDIMLIASGSGESRLPIEIAKIAKSKGATLCLITSAKTSTLSGMSDLVVYLPCPTKNDPTYGLRSSQPMTNLFDQSLHILGDVLAILIQQRKGLKDEELWRHHANLE